MREKRMDVLTDALRRQLPVLVANGSTISSRATWKATTTSHDRPDAAAAASDDDPARRAFHVVSGWTMDRVCQRTGGLQGRDALACRESAVYGEICVMRATVDVRCLTDKSVRRRDTVVANLSKLTQIARAFSIRET